MALRTVEEFKAGLRDGRAVYSRGEKVEDVTTHHDLGIAVECLGKDAEKVLKIIENFEDHDDVQKVHANFDIDDEEMARIEG